MPSIQSDLLGIPGLKYLPKALDGQEMDILLGEIDAMPWSRKFKRRVQEYGAPYDFRARTEDLDAPVTPIPHFVLRVATKLAQWGVAHEAPDQCSINEYLDGEGMSAHVDALPFDDGISILTLGSTCEMEFIHIATGKLLRFTPEVGSVLFLTGSSRYDWLHRISPRLSDHGHPRSRRVSLVTRKRTEV